MIHEGQGMRMPITPFLTKTYQLVDDHSIDDVISWNSDGTAFVVWRPAEFARDILPRFFKHNNLSSFVRQLNTYGFRKISDRWEFTNDNFRRGERGLLGEIHRRRNTSPTAPNATAGSPLEDGIASPTNSGGEELATYSGGSPPPTPSTFSLSTSNGGSEVTQLEEANHRLRHDNCRLSKELGRMKSLCSNIFNLVSGFNSSGEMRAEAGGVSQQLLNLMPASGLLDHPFGVSTKGKRSRDGELGDDMDLDLDFETLDQGREARDSMLSLRLSVAEESAEQAQQEGDANENS